MAAVKISNKLVALSLVVIVVGSTLAAATAGLFDWRSAAGKLPIVGNQISPPSTGPEPVKYSPLKIENDRLQKEVSGLSARLTRFQEQISSLRTEKDELKAELDKLRAEAGSRSNAEKGYQKLAQLYNQMKPTAAASIIAKQDDQTAVGILTKMETEQAGKVLGSLDPEKAARLAKLMVAGPVDSTAKEQ